MSVNLGLACCHAIHTGHMPYIQDNPFLVVLDLTSLSPITIHLLGKVQKIHFFTRKILSSSIVSFKFQGLVPKLFNSDF